MYKFKSKAKKFFPIPELFGICFLETFSTEASFQGQSPHSFEAHNYPISFLFWHDILTGFVQWWTVYFPLGFPSVEGGHAWIEFPV